MESGKSKNQKQASDFHLSVEEESKLVSKIAELEKSTTGELRIHIAKKTGRHGAINDAQKIFKKLGMNKTVNRNGILIYIATKSQVLSCIGDVGIHTKVGENFWKEVVFEMEVCFSKNEFFEGILKALEKTGAALKEHFPTDGSDTEDNPNELPNEISYKS